jgi:hypothetical protein
LTLGTPIREDSQMLQTSVSVYELRDVTSELSRIAKKVACTNEKLESMENDLSRIESHYIEYCDATSRTLATVVPSRTIDFQAVPRSRLIHTYTSVSCSALALTA